VHLCALLFLSILILGIMYNYVSVSFLRNRSETLRSYLESQTGDRTGICFLGDWFFLPLWDIYIEFP